MATVAVTMRCGHAQQMPACYAALPADILPDCAECVNAANDRRLAALPQPAPKPVGLGWCHTPGTEPEKNELIQRGGTWQRVVSVEYDDAHGMWLADMVPATPDEIARHDQDRADRRAALARQRQDIREHDEKYGWE